MKTLKLNLKELKVKSFITQANPLLKQTVKGGSQLEISTMNSILLNTAFTNCTCTSAIGVVGKVHR